MGRQHVRRPRYPDHAGVRRLHENERRDDRDGVTEGVADPARGEALDDAQDRRLDVPAPELGAETGVLIADHVDAVAHRQRHQADDGHADEGKQDRCRSGGDRVP